LILFLPSSPFSSSSPPNFGFLGCTLEIHHHRQNPSPAAAQKITITLQ
jgi:hypothetical protein